MPRDSAVESSDECANGYEELNEELVEVRNAGPAQKIVHRVPGIGPASPTWKRYSLQTVQVAGGTLRSVSAGRLGRLVRDEVKAYMGLCGPLSECRSSSLHSADSESPEE